MKNKGFLAKAMKSSALGRNVAKATSVAVFGAAAGGCAVGYDHHSHHDDTYYPPLENYEFLCSGVDAKGPYTESFLVQAETCEVETRDLNYGREIVCYDSYGVVPGTGRKELPWPECREASAPLPRLYDFEIACGVSANPSPFIVRNVTDCWVETMRRSYGPEIVCADPYGIVPDTGNQQFPSPECAVVNRTPAPSY